MMEGGLWMVSFKSNGAKSESDFLLPRFQIYVYFHPYLGKIPILTNIFQLG